MVRNLHLPKKERKGSNQKNYLTYKETHLKDRHNLQHYLGLNRRASIIAARNETGRLPLKLNVFYMNFCNALK